MTNTIIPKHDSKLHSTKIHKQFIPNITTTQEPIFNSTIRKITNSKFHVHSSKANSPLKQFKIQKLNTCLLNESQTPIVTKNLSPGRIVFTLHYPRYQEHGDTLSVTTGHSSTSSNKLSTWARISAKHYAELITQKNRIDSSSVYVEHENCCNLSCIDAVINK